MNDDLRIALIAVGFGTLGSIIGSIITHLLMVARDKRSEKKERENRESEALRQQLLLGVSDFIEQEEREKFRHLQGGEIPPPLFGLNRFTFVMILLAVIAFIFLIAFLYFLSIQTVTTLVFAIGFWGAFRIMNWVFMRLGGGMSWTEMLFFEIFY
jgi:hypothetical protein